MTEREALAAAGTGAAPPSEALTRSRIDHWLRNRGLQFYSANSNTRVGFGQTADAIIALMDDLAEYACGGAAQPPPSAPSLPDTFVERAIRTALVAHGDRDATVMLSGFEALYIKQKYAERNPSGVPREETKP